MSTTTSGLQARLTTAQASTLDMPCPSTARSSSTAAGSTSSSRASSTNTTKSATRHASSASHSAPARTGIHATLCRQRSTYATPSPAAAPPPPPSAPSASALAAPRGAQQPRRRLPRVRPGGEGHDGDDPRRGRDAGARRGEDGALLAPGGGGAQALLAGLVAAGDLAEDGLVRRLRAGARGEGGDSACACQPLRVRLRTVFLPGVYLLGCPLSRFWWRGAT